MNRFVLLCLLGWVAGLGMLAQAGHATVPDGNGHGHHAAAMAAPCPDTVRSHGANDAAQCERHAGACPCPQTCQSASVPSAADLRRPGRSAPDAPVTALRDALTGFPSPPWRPPSHFS